MKNGPEARHLAVLLDDDRVVLPRWMATKFMSRQAQFDAGVNMAEVVAEPTLFEAPKAAETPRGGYAGAAIQSQEDAPPCSTCGSIMIRSGSWYKCANCGTTSGCA